MGDNEPAAAGERVGDDGIAVATRQWRAQHPCATLTEIEQELDRQWRVVRAALIGQLALAAGEDLGRCPECGAQLTRRGQQERTLLTDGDEPIVLRRTYMSCPVCGHGLFPPG